MSKRLVIGRIAELDGVKTVIPLSQRALVFGYQRAVAALIEAARLYSETPNEETLRALKQAAHVLRKEYSAQTPP